MERSEGPDAVDTGRERGNRNTEDEEEWALGKNM